MKKIKLLIILLVTLSVFVGMTATGTVAAKEQPEGKPFNAIWEVIDNLLNKTEALAARVLALENWKVIIEEWQVWVNEKLTAVQEEVAGLGARLSSLEEPTTLLEKIKTVDGSGSGLDADLLDGYDSSEFLSVPWSRLTSFPANCPAGQYIYGIGETLNCSAPAGGIGGSGSDNYIPRWNGNSNLENSVIYQTDAGNIGIGTTAPTSKLTVNNTVTDHAITIEDARSGVGHWLRWTEGGIEKWVLGHIGSWVSGRANNFELVDGNRNTRIAVQAATGNVGIGTTNPEAKLEVNGNVKINTGGSANRVVCWKSDGKTLGYCLSQPDANGACICN